MCIYIYIYTHLPLFVYTNRRLSIFYLFESEIERDPPSGLLKKDWIERGGFFSVRGEQRFFNDPLEARRTGRWSKRARSRPRGCPLKIPPISDIVGIISERARSSLVGFGGRHGDRSYFSLDSISPPLLSLFPFVLFSWRDDKRGEITTSPLAATRCEVSPLNKLSGLSFYFSSYYPAIHSCYPSMILHAYLHAVFRLGTSVVKPIRYYVADIKYLSREREREREGEKGFRLGRVGENRIGARTDSATKGQGKTMVKFNTL